MIITDAGEIQLMLSLAFLCILALVGGTVASWPLNHSHVLLTWSGNSSSITSDINIPAGAIAILSIWTMFLFCNSLWLDKHPEAFRYSHCVWFIPVGVVHSLSVFLAGTVGGYWGSTLVPLSVASGLLMAGATFLWVARFGHYSELLREIIKESKVAIGWLVSCYSMLAYPLVGSHASHTVVLGFYLGLSIAVIGSISGAIAKPPIADDDKESRAMVLVTHTTYVILTCLGFLLADIDTIYMHVMVGVICAWYSWSFKKCMWHA